MIESTSNINKIVMSKNTKAHLDIENDLRVKKNGQVTFTIRVNNGEIVDFVSTEYVDVGRRILESQK